MFTETAPEAVLAEVRGHDFGAHPGPRFGANRIDAIVALDRAISAAQAEQMAQIAALHAERAALSGVGRPDPTISVIGEISMARKVGLAAAGTQVGTALAVERLPHAQALFLAGELSEPVIRAVVNESVTLGADDLMVLDGEIADQLVGLTRHEAARLTARAVIRIDAEAAATRAERNRADQRVSLFPDTDGVAHLHARGPAEQILAAHTALDQHARALRAAGDPRTLGQIMTQTLVERLTGHAHADDTNVEVHLVMDAETFTGQDTGEPVDLTGYGPISPSVADDIIAGAPSAWIRRFLVDPVDGTLIVREPRRRHFDTTTASHIRARDQRCRQPGCDLKIRHHDHIHPYVDGGETTAANGQGLCTRSHTLKHLPGWTVTPDGNNTVWQTPTGHTYISRPPPLLPKDQPHHPRE